MSRPFIPVAAAAAGVRRGALAVAAMLLAMPLARPLWAQYNVPSPADQERAAQLAATAAPPVDELVREALERSPAIAALRAEVAARGAEEAPAAALADPLVEAMLQNVGLDRWSVGDEDMSMLAAEARQELPYPGKRAAARGVAVAATASALARLVHLERQVIHDVRMLYADLYAIDGERQTTAAARELVELLEATARSRYAAGESEASALLRAQLERTRIEERLADLATERATKVAELNRWLDRAGDARLGEVRRLPPVHAPAAEIEALATSGAAEVAIGAAAVDAAQAELALRRLDLRPDFSVGAGLGWRGDLDPVLTLRLGVSLPLWRRLRQEPLIAAAEHRLSAAQHELADARAMARAETAALLAQFENADRQARRYREGILPQTSAALDASRAAYLGGRSSFGEVLESYELWLAARAQLARREADRYTAWAGLDHLARTHDPQGDPQ